MKDKNTFELKLWHVITYVAFLVFLMIGIMRVFT